MTMRSFSIVTKLAACLAMGASMGVAQTPMRIMDPESVSGNGAGWGVEPARGYLGFTFPVGTLQGDIPVPVVLRFNATHVVEERTSINPDGSLAKVNEDRPVHATLHFGFITPQNMYQNGYLLPQRWVLEDGTQLSWVDPGTYSLDSLSLPTQFGLAAYTFNGQVSPDGNYALYDTNVEGLGRWASSIPWPFDYVPTTPHIKILMDHDRARVFVFAQPLNAWVPIMWLDRFGHRVTFAWKRSPDYLDDSLTILNDNGKGLMVQWPVAFGAVTETDLLRVDWVNVQAPSLYVTGYPFVSQDRPTGFDAVDPSYIPAGPVLDNPFFVGRPTRIRMGNPADLPSTTWIPLPPPVNEMPWAPVFQWGFEYSPMKCELTAFTDPKGVRTTLSYTPAAVTQSMVESSSANPVINLFKPVTQAVGTDPLISLSLTQSWTRAIPSWNGSSYAPSSWTCMYSRHYSTGDASQEAKTQYTFAAPTLVPGLGMTEFFNGAVQYSQIKDGNGGVWSSTSYNNVTAGLDSSLTLPDVISTSRINEPNQKRTILWGVANPATEQLEVGATNTEKVVYTLESHPELLEFDRKTVVTTTRYDASGIALPAVIQKTEYDPTTSRPTRTYLDVGGLQKGTSFGYDSDGRLNSTSPHVPSFSGGNSSQSVTSFTADGWPSSSTTTYDTASGSATLAKSMSYTSTGLPIIETDAVGVTTTRSYDSRGRLKSLHRPGTPDLDISYSNDERTRTLHQDGRTSTENYDGFGRLKSLSRFDGVTETYVYDSSGRVTSVTESATGSRTRSTTYDPLGRPTILTPSSGPTVVFTLSAVGRNTQVNRYASTAISTTTLMDPWGQVIYATDAKGTSTTTTYNALGQPTQVQQIANDGQAQTPSRNFGYNAIGFLTSQTTPETGTTTFSGHNKLGLPTYIKEDLDASGNPRILSLAYDGLGRLTGRTGTNESDSYQFTGMLLTSASSTSTLGSVTQTYTYTNPGKILSQESTTWNGLGGLTSIIQYTTDNAGHLTQLTYPEGRTVQYDWSVGRIVGMRMNGIQQIVKNIGYDGWGHLNLLQYGSNAQDQWTYNGPNASLGSWTATPVTDPAETRTYSYNANLHLSNIAPDFSNLSHNALTHDNSGRLTSATGYGLTQTFAHDGFDNNTSSVVTAGTAPAWVNNFTLPNTLVDNKIPPTQPNSGITGWAMTRGGEATQIDTGVSANKYLNFAWDSLGRLASVSSDGLYQSHLYSPLGLRVQRTDSVDPTRNRAYGYTSNGLLLTEYVPSSAGRIGGSAARVFHQSANPGAMSRSLGSFAQGDTVTLSVWFKAPPGVSGAMALHDGRVGDPLDSKRFVSMVGNGAWQQLQITLTLARADTLWVQLYGDMYTSTSASATSSTFVDYDDIAVTKNGSALMQEGFESGLNVGADPTSLSSWYTCAPGLATLQTVTGTPDQWKRDVIYLYGRAIAEVDANGVHELHSDHMGTPRIITSGITGRVEGKQAFAPFGELITDAGVTWGYQPLIGYTGHLQADPTGLVYMRQRYYSPAWHRFINSDQGVDPNQLNQFAYVGGSPFHLADFWGLSPSTFIYDGWTWTSNGDGTWTVSKGSTQELWGSDGRYLGPVINVTDTMPQTNQDLSWWQLTMANYDNSSIVVNIAKIPVVGSIIAKTSAFSLVTTHYSLVSYGAYGSEVAAASTLFDFTGASIATTASQAALIGQIAIAGAYLGAGIAAYEAGAFVGSMATGLGQKIGK